MKSTKIMLDVSTAKERRAAAGDPGQQWSWFWSATVRVAQLPTDRKVRWCARFAMGL